MAVVLLTIIPDDVSVGDAVLALAHTFVMVEEAKSTEGDHVGGLVASSIEGRSERAQSA